MGQQSSLRQVFGCFFGGKTTGSFMTLDISWHLLTIFDDFWVMCPEMFPFTVGIVQDTLAVEQAKSLYTSIVSFKSAALPQKANFQNMHWLLSSSLVIVQYSFQRAPTVYFCNINSIVWRDAVFFQNKQYCVRKCNILWNEQKSGTSAYKCSNISAHIFECPVLSQKMYQWFENLRGWSAKYDVHNTCASHYVAFLWKQQHYIFQEKIMSPKNAAAFVFGKGVKIYIWLAVSTHLKNMSQFRFRWLFATYGILKNVPNHQPDTFTKCNFMTSKTLHSKDGECLLEGWCFSFCRQTGLQQDDRMQNPVLHLEGHTVKVHTGREISTTSP